MTDSSKYIFRQVRLGWVLLAVGAVFIASGILLRLINPPASLNPKIVETPGILLAGWGVILLARFLLAGAAPQAAQRIAAEENDERSPAARHLPFG